jgi:hypothetical protein
VEDNLRELAVALAAAVQARLPQADLGDLAGDLARALRQDREDQTVAARSATLMARVSACLPARLIIETRLGLDGAVAPAPAPSAATSGEGEHQLLGASSLRIMCRPREARPIAMARARVPLKPPPLR